MTQVIYKYKLRDAITVIPKGQVVLVAQQEEGDASPTVWVKHDPKDIAPDDGMALYVFGTGHDIGYKMVHVGSCVCSPFVWHVFKEP